MKLVKYLVLGALVLAIGFVIWQEGLSLNIGQSKTISVTGEGKVKMKPEVARFTAGIQVYGATVSETMDKADKIIKDTISVLKNAGINEEDIKTTSFSVWPQTSDSYENNMRRQVITGYSVSNNVEVKVRNINSVSDLIAKVVNAGANNIYGVTFGADDPQEQEAEAREKAIEGAREKAESMAISAGRKLGKIISISENYNSYAPYRTGDGMGGGGGGPEVEPGGLEVTQTVNVVFELR